MSKHYFYILKKEEKIKCLLTILLSSDCGEEFERMSTQDSELGWLSAGVHPGGQ